MMERPLLLVQLKLTNSLSAIEIQRLRQGLRVRAGLDNIDDVQLDVIVASVEKGKAKVSKR